MSTEVRSVHKIENKEVEKRGSFLGFDIFIHDDGEEQCGNITAFFVRDNKVLGRCVVSHAGGAYNSSSADIEFEEEPRK